MSEPLSHREAEAWLPDYDRGRLDRDATRRLHLHFKDCDACQTRFRMRSLELSARQALKERLAPDRVLTGGLARNRALLGKVLMTLVLVVLFLRLAGSR